MIAMARRSFIRHSALAAAALGIAAGSIGSVRADIKADGQTLVRTMAEPILAMLRTKGLDRAAREGRFRSIYRQHFDTATIASWVMGRAWQAATPKQRSEYLQVFETYVVKIYTAQLATYGGEQFRVTGAEADGDGVVVISAIVDPQGQRSIDVKWRLRKSDATLKVRDVVIENISMSLNQRREFASVLQQNNNSIDALIGTIRAKIVELDRK